MSLTLDTTSRKAEHARMFIGGEWAAAGAGATFPTVDPNTGETIARIPRGDSSDVDRAVAAAKKAAVAWQFTDAVVRAGLLRALAAKVTESADSQLARFKTDGGRAQFIELTETRAELQLRHPNGDEHTESFTIEDARKAGLAGPGTMYTKYPKAMLRSRVITAALKSIGWEGGTGVYDPAEAAEFAPTPVRTPAAQAIAADADGVVAPGEMTLEEARAYPFPFQKGKPQHGRPMGELDSDMLRSVEAWVREKRAEKGDATWHADTTEAIGLILFDRDQEQGALPLEEDGPSIDDLPDPTQPGVAHAVADAVGAKQAAQRAAAADDTDLPF